MINEIEAFSIPEAERRTDRIAAKCFSEIARLLGGKTIAIDGRDCRLFILTKGKTKMMFDVLDPDDTIDHIEFTITKTGWGRALIKEGGTND